MNLDNILECDKCADKDSILGNMRDNLLRRTLKTYEREIEVEYELEQAYGVPYGKYINRLDTNYFDSEEYRCIFK